MYNSISEMRQELTNSFKEVDDWAAANKLPRSEAKSKSALVTGKRFLDKIDQDDLQLEIPAKNGHVLVQVYCATVLGLDIDVQLSFTCHVEKVCKKISKRIGILNKIKTCLPLKQRIIVYNAMIKPVITYANVVWHNCSSKDNLHQVLRFRSEQPGLY